MQKSEDRYALRHAWFPKLIIRLSFLRVTEDLVCLTQELYRAKILSHRQISSLKTAYQKASKCAHFDVPTSEASQTSSLKFSLHSRSQIKHTSSCNFDLIQISKDSILNHVYKSNPLTLQIGQYLEVSGCFRIVGILVRMHQPCLFQFE